MVTTIKIEFKPRDILEARLSGKNLTLKDYVSGLKSRAANPAPITADVSNLMLADIKDHFDKQQGSGGNWQRTKFGKPALKSVKDSLTAGNSKNQSYVNAVGPYITMHNSGKTDSGATEIVAKNGVMFIPATERLATAHKKLSYKQMFSSKKAFYEAVKRGDIVKSIRAKIVKREFAWISAGAMDKIKGKYADYVMGND